MFPKELPFSTHSFSSVLKRGFLVVSLSAYSLNPVLGINPNEIQEDLESEQPEEFVWPDREFPDPKLSNNGFHAGERFQYRGQWGIFRKVAQIVISTESAEHADPSVLIVKTEAQTSGLIKALFPLILEGQSLLQSQEGRILENWVTDKGRSNEKETKTSFDYEAGVMHHEDKLRPERNAVKDLPYPAPLDYASAILQIRGWDLSVGSQHPLFISSNGKFYLIEMETKGIENMATKFGQMDAFRVEPISAYPQSRIFREGGKMAIWISSDERRIPLRLDVKTSFGSASMRLDAFTINGSSLIATSH